ncbi:MAG: prepilin peptidase [Chloroflexi bacterium]|nr:prepilin peptidase [Chloroflexota bacterium]
MGEIAMLLGMLAAGLGAGTLVTMIARSLPERNRFISRPICAEQGCTLDWHAASQALRAAGVARDCPTCGAGPARGDILLELATAGIFGALALVTSTGFALAINAVFATLLMMILAIDLRHRQVYLIMGYGGILLALLVAPMSMSGGLLSAAVGGIVGGLAFGGLYLLGRVIYRGGEPLGTGDITIAALLGAMAGFPGILTALLVGILTGGVGAVLILTLGGSRKVFMPYGPALCVGGLWVMLVR